MIRVNLVSESEFTVKGHGVHTAFVEMRDSLKKQVEVDLAVNRLRKADVTHIHTVGAYSILHMFGRSKKVITAHVVPDSFFGSLRGAEMWLPLAKLYLRWFYNRADVVLAVSNETKKDLVTLGVKKPIEVFHNTIDTTRYRLQADSRDRARRTLRLPDSGTVVIGAGQVQPRKRIDSFIATAKKLSNVTFIWVGGMPFGKVAAEHDEMEQLIATAPDNVHFPGVVPLEKMKQYYAASDIFMLPSDQETFGLVVVEAAAAGLPVVLRDIPDYNETFRDDALMSNENGFADAIRKLATDSDYYDLMREKAANIAARFDSVEGAKRLVALYRSLLA